MEFMSAAWWSALAAIILIDLVLAGDNAIVIALAARRLPAAQQRRAIIWGTAGAIGVRVLMTLIVVWLLKVPGLMLIGGIGLVWIAAKLLKPHDEATDDAGHAPEAVTFAGALKTIVVADALMGLDNVLGIAGAAHGNFGLVVIGLLISVPIVVLGSTAILKLVERFPAITYVGAGVLAFTAARMIIAEPLVRGWFEAQTGISWLFQGGIVLAVLAWGWLSARRARARQARHLNAERA